MGRDLPGGLLKQVSRSFYLSLAILPRSLRAPVGLAYLLARAADTIADTRLISRDERLLHLEALRAELKDELPGRVTKIVSACIGSSSHAGEQQLLRRLPDCLGRYRQLDKADRDRIQWLLLTITEGMSWDLRTFPGEDEARLAVLESREELDRYTYSMAGCVGEFWTEMHVAHRSRLSSWNVPAMKAQGIRFGKGLQMTNILRDLASDLRHGRCYLPRHDLSMLGLKPEDLLEPSAVDRVRPLLRELLGVILEHYEQGWRYTLAIPKLEWRMRLACAWPLLIGLGTLRLIGDSPNLLDPGRVIKIPRSMVYSILLRSFFEVWSNGLLTAAAGRRRGTIHA